MDSDTETQPQIQSDTQKEKHTLHFLPETRQPTEYIDKEQEHIEEDLTVFDPDLKDLPYFRESLASTYIQCLRAFHEAHPDISDDDLLRAVQDMRRLVLRGRLHVGNEILELSESLRDLPGKRSKLTYIAVREHALSLYVENKDLLIQAMQDNVTAAHGSQSGSLLGTIQHGLVPLGRMQDYDIIPGTGEQYIAGASVGKDHVSFYHWFAHNALDYAGVSEYGNEPISEDQLRKLISMLEAYTDEYAGNDVRRESAVIALHNAKKTLAFLEKPDKTEEEALAEDLLRKNFPVVYLASTQSISDSRIITPSGTMQYEFAVESGLDVNHISVILVPQSEIAAVEKIIGKYIPASAKKPKIFPIEDYAAAFGVNTEAQT